MNLKSNILATLAPLVVVVSFLVTSTVQDESHLCGRASPDPTKTCISVRLPWNRKPIYFCTERSSFKYKNQCHHRSSFGCGRQDLQKHTLLVGVPWSCCPLSSDPDTCANHRCPPPPHNRTCQTLEPDPSKIYECCPSYFCEKDSTPEACYIKRLEPECNVPPEKKTNCVAFEDPYGCCPKFHCDEDARPGYCPAQLEAIKFMARFNTTTATANTTGAGGDADGGNDIAADEDHSDTMADSQPEAEVAHAPMRMAKMRVGGFGSSYYYGHNNHDIQCIGDFNCPGRMKCCSSDMNVYLEDGLYYFKNTMPTDGQCMEPAKDEDKKKS